MINALTGSLDNLDTALASVLDDGWDWAEKEGKWSIRQVTHHLAEDCNVYTFIIERGLGNAWMQGVLWRVSWQYGMVKSAGVE